MARGKSKKVADVGHNTEMTDEEKADAWAVFSFNIRRDRKAAAVAKAAADAAKAKVNGHHSQARGVLGMTRKEQEELLELEDMTEAEFIAAEAKRQARIRISSIAIGAQLELFPAEPTDTADDKAITYAAGKRAGLRGDDPECPDTIAAILRADWEQGWADGQKELGERLFRGNAFLEAQKPKPVAELEEDDEDEGDDLDPDAIDDKARKLKRAGWTQPTAEEAAFVGAEA